MIKEKSKIHPSYMVGLSSYSAHISIRGEEMRRSGKGQWREPRLKERAWVHPSGKGLRLCGEGGLSSKGSEKSLECCEKEA